MSPSNVPAFCYSHMYQRTAQTAYYHKNPFPLCFYGHQAINAVAKQENSILIKTVRTRDKSFIIIHLHTESCYFSFYVHACNVISCVCLQFYFQNGRPPPNELKEQCLLRIDHLFHDHLDGLQIHGEILHISGLQPEGSAGNWGEMDFQ